MRKFYKKHFLGLATLMLLPAFSLSAQAGTEVMEFNFNSFENLQSYVPGLTEPGGEGWTSTTSLQSYYFDEVTFESEGVTLFADGSSLGSFFKSNRPRFCYSIESEKYTFRAGAVVPLTFSIPEETSLDNIKFNVTSQNSGLLILKDDQPGSLTQEFNEEGNFYIWSPGDENVSTVTITVNSSITFNYIQVTLSTPGGDIEPEPDPIPSVPENLYILGNIRNNAWDYMSAPQAEITGEGVFTFSNILLDPSSSEIDAKAYFTFINIRPEEFDNGSYWDIINDGQHRYGPADPSFNEFELEEENAFVLAGDASWTIIPGLYNFTVDFNSMTAVAEKVILPPPTLYIVGDEINGEESWTAIEANILSYNEETGLYYWNGTKLAKGFKFNDGSWDGSYNIGSNEENSIITLDVAYNVINSNGSGNINIAEDTYIENPSLVLDIENWTLALSGTIVNETPEVYTPEAIYFMNSGNDWGPGIELKKIEEGIYSGIGELAAADSIEFKLDAENEHWYGCIPGEENVDFVEGESIELSISSIGNNWTLYGWEGGEIKLTVDWNAMTLTIVALNDDDEGGNDGPGTGVEQLINAIEKGETVYNIQGLRVTQKELTPGLYIINGKKILVK